MASFSAGDEAEASPNWALFLNCLGDEKPYRNILQELTKDERCKEGHTYKWPVSNKYYSADIYLHSVHAPLQEHSVTLTSHNYQAIVMFVDSSSSSSSQAVSARWSIVSKCVGEVPDVGVLVAVGSGEEQQMQELLQWSVSEGVELIEWGVSEECDEERGEDGGVERLTQTLQAHMWPQIHLNTSNTGHGPTQGQEEEEPTLDPPSSLLTVIKESRLAPPTSSVIADDVAPLTSSVIADDVAPPTSSVIADEKVPPGCNSSGDTVLTSAPKSSNSCADSIPDYSSAEEKLLAEGLDSSKGPGGETFEQLFTRFAAMKEHAESLSHEERKVYAEKVVLAFWDAVGGDEDEVREPDTNT